jgi:Tfp pilus assembly protein PilX
VRLHIGLGILILDYAIYMSHNTKLICLFLKAQKIDKSSEQGYAMAIVSMLSIIMLSLLAASMTFSNLAKSRTDAFVDGQSAFAVAEAGLNKRAIEVSKKIQSNAGLEGVSSTTTASQALATCFGVGILAGSSGDSDRTGSNDFECANYQFQSSNNASRVANAGNISLNSNGQDSNKYVAYTVVVDRTKYVGGVPAFTRIPSGETYSGLNAAEYTYEVHATGRKPIALSQGSTLPVYTPEQTAAKNRQSLSKPAETGDAALIVAYDAATAQATAATTTASNSANDSSNNTSLSMTFTNRVIPLFQFGIFYNGDLELNSTSPMQINGRVHSNANIYVQPTGLDDPAAPQSITTFLSNVSAAGSIYNRVDAWADGSSRTGITRVLLTGTSCSPTTNCQEFDAYNSSVQTPLTATQISAFSNKVTGGTNTASDKLEVPKTSFTRKRNYADNTIGEYYAKADMRLEMVPDRDVTSKTSTPAWTRNTAIIPFNFTAITTSGTGACTTTTPTAGNDPAATYVDPDRDKRSRLKCNVLTKGQLQSLRQPVMVLTNINQNSFTSTKTNAEIRTIESTTLGAPSLTAIVRPVLSTTADTNATKQKILRALQVALVSTPSPVRFERLDNAFNTGVYVLGSPEAPFKTAFSDLIDTISELSALDRFNLLQSSPNQIAALMDAWFLPAPIQRLERPTTDTNATAAANNPRKSGFYDGREQRWITMLQTNIASLSVWNRDGLYVTADDETMTTGYTASTANRTAAFASGSGTNFTDGMAFDRAAADSTKPEGSLQYLGLGSSDKTEGGLVFHASVRDDLDGNGTITSANDITVSTASSQQILKKNSDNSNFTDSSGNVVVMDYYRTYPSQVASKQSPFGFAFNGGNYLPNALMLSSDQAVYVQGNFNNNGSNGTLPTSAPNTPSPDRLPAAIVADTITVLSNECVSTNTGATNSLSVPLGQLKCGLPPTIDGTAINSPNTVASSMAINAAFVANTPVSVGNLGTGRGFASTTKSYSGGVNNYMRLLEDWQSGGGYALHYAGSLISLREPLEYSGLYRSGGTDPLDPTDTSYYNVPFRNFNYDPNFDNMTTLPPLTPKVTNIKQRNFIRGY